MLGDEEGCGGGRELRENLQSRVSGVSRGTDSAEAPGRNTPSNERG